MCTLGMKSLYSGSGLSRLILIHSKGISSPRCWPIMWVLILKLSKSFFNESGLIFLMHRSGIQLPCRGYVGTAPSWSIFLLHLEFEENMVCIVAPCDAKHTCDLGYTPGSRLGYKGNVFISNIIALLFCTMHITLLVI